MALRLGDVVALHQLVQHARQALLGDAQDAQQVADGDARVAADEVQRTVMRAAKAELVQDDVRGSGEIAIGEEHQVLGGADFFLAQEQQIGPGPEIGGSGFSDPGVTPRIGPPLVRPPVVRPPVVRHGRHSSELRQEY